jgi:hypothetical protein
LVLKPLRANAIGYVVFIVILGALVPNIDQEAHLGGLALGFIGGLLMSRPWPVIKSRWVALRRAIAAVFFAALLAGGAFAVTRSGATRLPPALRFQHIEEQIAPALAEFNAIGEEIPSSLALQRDRGDPAAAQTYLRAIRSLTERGTKNLARFRHSTTSDPALRAMVDSLVEAQTGQLARLQAARRYLETGDSLELTGPDGFLAAKAVADQAVRRFQQQQLRFLSDQRLITIPHPAEP